mmetsp:Transcript_31552/g.86953  ORF Transcript_31552/g.86953 Transcript_31552/m.86953 type:complete len:249 (-) Transcript_31552:11-757(-)
MLNDLRCRGGLAHLHRAALQQLRQRLSEGLLLREEGIRRQLLVKRLLGGNGWRHHRCPGRGTSGHRRNRFRRAKGDGGFLPRALRNVAALEGWRWLCWGNFGLRCVHGAAGGRRNWRGTLGLGFRFLHFGVQHRARRHQRAILGQQEHHTAMLISAEGELSRYAPLYPILKCNHSRSRQNPFGCGGCQGEVLFQLRLELGELSLRQPRKESRDGPVDGHRHDQTQPLQGKRAAADAAGGTGDPRPECR